MYDGGENPRKSTVIGEGVRQELAAVIYVIQFSTHFMFIVIFYKLSFDIGHKRPRV